MVMSLPGKKANLSPRLFSNRYNHKDKTKITKKKVSISKSPTKMQIKIGASNGRRNYLVSLPFSRHAHKISEVKNTQHFLIFTLL